VPVGSLPDPTSPGIIAVASIVAGFFGTTLSLWQDKSRDDVRWTAFLSGYLGVGFGLLTYCVSLIIELY
jgi:uncharacterized membrane protein